MSHPIKVGSIDQIAYFRAYNDDGSPKTDLTSATVGLTVSIFRVGATPVSIASLSDKAADDTTHADGAIRPVQGNLYTIDLPDAAISSQVASITVKGTFTGGVIDSQPHPVVGYDATAVAVGANTTTPPTLAQFVNTDTGETTAVAGSVAKLAQGGASSVTLTPITSTVGAGVVSEEAVTYYIGEGKDATITVVDGDGNAIDMTAKTLEMIVEDTDKTDYFTVSDASISKGGVGGNVLTITIPASSISRLGTYRYSIRDVADPYRVWARGNLIIDYAPKKD